MNTAVCNTCAYSTHGVASSNEACRTCKWSLVNQMNPQGELKDNWFGAPHLDVRFSKVKEVA